MSKETIRDLIDKCAVIYGDEDVFVEGLDYLTVDYVKEASIELECKVDEIISCNKDNNYSKADIADKLDELIEMVKY